MRDHWIEQSTRNPYIRLLALVVGLFFLGWAVYGLRGVLTPVFISFLIAYLLDPVVDRFEARRVNRTVAIIILMIALFLATGVMVFLIGLAISELVDVLKTFPAWLEATVREWRETWQEQPVVVWISETLGLDIGSADAGYVLNAIQQFREQLLGLAPRLAGPVRSILSSALSGTMALVAWAANLILIPLFSFYLLRDFDRIVARIRALIPDPYRDEVSKVFREIDETIAAFVRGQLLVMLILGVLYGAGLALFQVKMGFGIGLLAGLLSVIPYMGFAIGIVVALIMSLMGGDLIWLNLLGTVVTFGVVQILEGTVITPKIVGDKVGLHPVWVIVALLIGAHMLGVLGMLLAVPLAAVIRIILHRAEVRYKASRFFAHGAERFGTRPPPPSADKPDPEAKEPEDEEPEDEEPGDAADESSAEPAVSSDLRRSVDAASRSNGLRESVDAIAKSESDSHEASAPRAAGAQPEDDAAAEIFADEPEAPATPEEPRASGTPGEPKPGAKAFDEAWARRLGRPSRDKIVDQPDIGGDQAKAKTLPDHPMRPELEKLIKEQKKEEETPPAGEAQAPENKDEGGKTLPGMPLKKQDEEGEKES